MFYITQILSFVCNTKKCENKIYVNLLSSSGIRMGRAKDLLEIESYHSFQTDFIIIFKIPLSLAVRVVRLHLNSNIKMGKMEFRVT